MAQKDHDHFALPSGYRLNEYCIQKVLGQGGFGITYLAHDERLDLDVAVKEFMPSDLAMRQVGSTVMPRSMAARQDYKEGLERFLKEARTLARFTHANIVRVMRLFEANGTAYIVMSYEAGESLESRLRARGGALAPAELRAIAGPLLDGLAAVHKAGFLHRDIKPSNIFLRADGSPVLLDFGTARQITGNASRSIVAILTPGYAPNEQYNVKSEQGAWTDIYGMGAVLYHCVSGRVPPEAPARAQAYIDKQPDPLQAAKLVGQGRYPERFLKAIDQSLAILSKDRLQSVVELRQALEVIVGPPPPPPPSWFGQRWPALTAGAGALLLATAILIVLFRPPDPPPIPVPPPPIDARRTLDAPGDEAALSTARQAIQVSADYGRKSYRRFRQKEALPSLEQLAKGNTRYQKQLDDARQAIEGLDRETASLLQQYVGLVGQLAKHPAQFEQIKNRLSALDLSEVDKLARRHLIEHVEASARGPNNATELQAGLDRSYSSRDLW